MSKRIGYMFQSKQLTLVLDGQPHDIAVTHSQYKKIGALLSAPSNETDEEEAIRLTTLQDLVFFEEKKREVLAQEIRAKIGFDDVKIEHGCVTIKGKEIHNNLTQRILELEAAGLPYAPFINFLVNLEQNPSEASRNNLFNFLEQGRFPLTDDGCFLAYKGVKDGRIQVKVGEVVEWKDTLVDCRTGKFDNSPGSHNEMPWEDVDANNGEACGRGFHVGTVGHASHFGSTMILVKVNPKDCVSVPLYDKTKLRCCSYVVVNIFKDRKKAKELVLPAYSQEQYKEKNFEADEKKYEKEMQDEEEAETELEREDLQKQTRDDLCRQAARMGICASTNEAREMGKDLIIEAILLNALPFGHMSRDQVVALAVRRRLFASENAAKKAGREALEQALTASTNQIKIDLGV